MQSDFLDNYNRIALTIDQELKSKSIEWLIGELPPFGNDANPWCNCQDYATERYWEIITLQNIQSDGNSAAFDWTWGDGCRYKVRAKKEHETWKIDYLQGFDFNEFVK